MIYSFFIFSAPTDAAVLKPLLFELYLADVGQCWLLSDTWVNKRLPKAAVIFWFLMNGRELWSYNQIFSSEKWFFVNCKIARNLLKNSASGPKNVFLLFFKFLSHIFKVLILRRQESVSVFWFFIIELLKILFLDHVSETQASCLNNWIFCFQYISVCWCGFKVKKWFLDSFI